MSSPFLGTAILLGGVAALSCVFYFFCTPLHFVFRYGCCCFLCLPAPTRARRAQISPQTDDRPLLTLGRQAEEPQTRPPTPPTPRTPTPPTPPTPPTTPPTPPTPQRKEADLKGALPATVEV